ncbi:acid phosphatase-related [Holotrichia oblita]|uniref:Acid phosphatase-related n=1 Tax=Holotrichia oblita TaxID=644536 RepID=A0ACB9SWL0_HOLOL|nr:acid phosphatase-related [Holotrichia oblita]
MVTQLGTLIFCALIFCTVDARTKLKEYHNSPNSLRLLHVVFRHGDRTQDGAYPTDPYRNETFYPVGLGQLTNAGKVREYNIGRYLRSTYNGFIPTIYSPGILEAISSPYPRCKASMQLVLAGLFPPVAMQKWSPSLNWNPIPYDYSPQSGNMLFFSYSNCPNYWTLIAEYRESSTFKKVYEPYEDVVNYLMEKSGLTPSPFGVALLLYSTLRSQQEWGLTLPDWTRSVWPEPVTYLTKLDWQQLFPTEKTRPLGAGFLMSKIINDTQLFIDKDPSVEGLKTHLYSGHDLNIAAILTWLGTPDIHVPQYGSFIIFEIHEISNVPHVRVVHQNYEYGTPQVVEIPHCGFYCPFGKFIELYSNYTNRFDLCYG